MIYYQLPLSGRLNARPLAVLIVTGAVLAGLVVWQIRSVVNAKYPMIRAIEALFTLVPLLLLSYAAAYCAMSLSNDANFNETLTRTDGIYFTVTVFATVGFGDITAVTQSARLVVTSQMLIDLLIFGLGLRVFVDAVRRGRERQASST